MVRKVAAHGDPQTIRELERIVKERQFPHITEFIPNGPARLTAYVPDNMLTDLIEIIKNIPGFDRRESIVEVSAPEFVISPALDELRRKQETEENGEKPKEKPLVEQLIESADKHTEFDRNKIVLSAIAGMVALIGLFLNNVGIIIGAMLISPLLGPIYAFAVNSAVGDTHKVFNTVKILAALIVMVVGISFVATFVLSFFTDLTITNEITTRLVADPVYVVMAILLGFATIYALYRGIPEGIAGVAVAAALLPPAVVIGIALVLEPASAAKAVTLTLQNVFGLITGGVIATIVLQVRPRGFIQQWEAKKLMRRVVWTLVILIILLIALSYLV